METTLICKGKILDWLEEIDKCVSFKERENISCASLIKEIIIKNGFKLRQELIEDLKFQLIKFVLSGGEDLGLTRASGLFMSKEDIKYFPFYNGFYRSHLFIRPVIWVKYFDNKLVKENDQL